MAHRLPVCGLRLSVLTLSRIIKIYNKVIEGDKVYVMSLIPLLNQFVEKVLKVRTYPAKVTLLFGTIASVSLIAAFLIDVYISMGEVERNVKLAANRAAKFRIQAIISRLREIYRKDSLLLNLLEEGKTKLSDITSLSSTVLCAGYLKGGKVASYEGSYPLSKVKEAVKGLKSSDPYFVYVDPNDFTVVMFIRAEDKIYYFCHEASDLRVLLSKKLGAIARYGAEFYFGKEPKLKEGDILVSAPTPNLSSRIYVHVPKERIVQAFLIERATLYARLFLLIWITYILGYLAFSKLLMYPVRRLQTISNKLLKGEWNVDFMEFKTAQDEFGDIGRTLERLSKKEMEYRERVGAVFKIVMKGITQPEELPEFVDFVLKTLRETFKAKHALFLVKELESNKISFRVQSYSLDVPSSALSELTQEVASKSVADGSVIKRNLKEGCADVFVFDAGDTHRIVLGMLLDSHLSEDDISYVKIVLRNLVYVLSLIHIATVDLLTSLPNRRSFENDLSRYRSISLRYSRPLSLLLIDIDDFKAVNDVHGHQAGDLVLKKVAAIMKKSVRESDTVYRYGGEEFAVLLPETGKEQAKEVARKILENVRKETFWVGNDTSLYITVSIGIAGFPEDTVFPEQLVSIADVSLYKAKGEGKNRFAVVDKREYSEIYIKSFQREKELVKSIKEGRLVPYFQPVYDLRENRIFGYEVLSRMIRPNGEIVSASEFVYKAAKSNLVEEIDAAIYTRAKELFGCEKESNFFINASPNSLEKERIMGILEEIPPELRGKIYIEITESEAFSDMERALSIIRNLKGLGYKIALDDFGAGFSSMLYLKYLIGSVDLIKVDGHFIKGMHRDKNNKVFLRSIKLISYAFKVPLLGEWVETQEEYELIKRLGFRFGQGYFFGEPCPDCCELDENLLERGFN